MNIKHYLCGVGVLLLASSVALAKVQTWPAVEVRTASPLSVQVNGTPVEVMMLPAPSHCLSGENAQPYGVAYFAADSEVEVAITDGGYLGDARILPTSKGIKPIKQDKGSLRFKAKPPFTVVIEPEGRHHALVLCASVPNTPTFKKDDPNVVYFGPGRHHPKDVIRLHSNQTLYLAPGAYVEGAVVGEGDNITVCGEGILSGAPWAWCHGPWGHMMSLKGRNITVKDITLMSAWTWTLVLSNCEKALVERVKILNGRVLNDDGIDVCECKDVVIRDCFVRSQDDCIAPKWSDENLLVENCMLWTDVANIIRIGYECAGKDKAFRHLVFRGIDVLHQSIHKTPSYEYWAENVIFIQPANETRFEDLLFEDFRFDGIEPGDLFMTIKTFKVNDQWQKNKQAGYCDGVVVRNVHFPKMLPAQTMGVRLESHDPQHTVKNVRFENVTGCGPLETIGEITGITIPPQSFAKPPLVTKWKGSGADWAVSNTLLRALTANGTIDAVMPEAIGGVITARLTPEKGPAKPSDPTTFGLRFIGKDGYWGLSFWRPVGEAGMAAENRFEFEEMIDGKRSSHGNLKLVYHRDTGRWAFGRTYIFTMQLTTKGIAVAVFDEQTGKEVYAEARAFEGKRVVLSGRPTFYAWGTYGTVQDVTWTY